ncbi:MAG: hypothetical protein HOO67_03980 [Candidatus Peribacteraceae bacterium]|nr:hypothetical protein [Candidatus Peribacteraceae bacterium]
MNPHSSAKNSGAATKTKTLLEALSGWLPLKKEQAKLKKVVPELSDEDLSKISRLLKKCGKPPAPSGSLQDYLNWHFAEKEKRAEIVENLAVLRPKEQEDMKRAIMMEGRRLTEPELDAVFKNETTMLQYFSTLTGSQLEAYLRKLDDPAVEMPANVKKGMRKMFTAFRDERLKFEEAWAEKIGPHIEDIAATQTIMDQLGQLEKIQKQLSR